MRIKLLWTTICFLVSMIVNGQHVPLYSQYALNGLPLNPAYAGRTEALNISGFVRNQWTGFQGSPKTQLLSAHMPLKNEKISLGAIIYHDGIGVTSRTGLTGIYAYRIQVGKGRLSAGIQAGLTSIRNQWTEVITNSNDPVFSMSEKDIVPQAGAGMYYYTKGMFAGISIPQMIVFNPKHGEYAYNTALINSGFNKHLTRDLSVSPSILLKIIKNSPVQVDLNTIFTFKDLIGLGFSYRKANAIVLMLNYRVNEQLTFGYSYDKNTGKLRSYEEGSHEIMISYNFKYKIEAKSPRSL